jgi:hypothetical protein
MSNTGVYVMRGKQLVKVSNEVRRALSFSDVTFDKPFITDDLSGYPIEVKSARHKKKLMEHFGVREPVDHKDTAKNLSNRNKGTPINAEKFVSQNFRDRGIGHKGRLKIVDKNPINVNEVKDDIDKKCLKEVV